MKNINFKKSVDKKINSQLSNFNEKIDDQINQELENNIEEQIQDQVNQELENNIEEQIQDQVNQELESNIEEQIQDQINQELENNIEDQIQDQKNQSENNAPNNITHTYSTQNYSLTDIDTQGRFAVFSCDYDLCFAILDMKTGLFFKDMHIPSYKTLKTIFHTYNSKY